jgi:hypothetical protein
VIFLGEPGACREGRGESRRTLVILAAGRPGLLALCEAVFPAVPGLRGRRVRGGQAGLICLASWLVISTLRGLAASCTGMLSVSTPAV